MRCLMSGESPFLTFSGRRLTRMTLWQGSQKNRYTAYSPLDNGGAWRTRTSVGTGPPGLQSGAVATGPTRRRLSTFFLDRKPPAAAIDVNGKGRLTAAFAFAGAHMARVGRYPASLARFRVNSITLPHQCDIDFQSQICARGVTEAVCHVLQRCYGIHIWTNPEAASTFRCERRSPGLGWR